MQCDKTTLILTIMTKYTVIDDFRQISFTSYKKALAYCAENNVSQSNIFVDER